MLQPGGCDTSPARNSSLFRWGVTMLGSCRQAQPRTSVSQRLPELGRAVGVAQLGFLLNGLR